MTDGEIVIVSVSEGGAGFVKATNQWSGLSDPLDLMFKARRNSVSKWKSPSRQSGARSGGLRRR